MVRINLLPYRQERRRRQILQHLVVAVGTVIFTLVTIAGIHMYFTSELQAKKERLASLRAENQALVKKIGKIKDFDKLKRDVENKLRLVDELEKSRFRSLGRLIALSRAIPDNVWLNTVTDEGRVMRLSGFGESNKAIANFMRRIDQSETFGDVRLEVIRRVKLGNISVREFTLTMAIQEEKEKKSLKGKRS
jgi:type IV pilus assembly protein PilN